MFENFDMTQEDERKICSAVGKAIDCIQEEFIECDEGHYAAVIFSLTLAMKRLIEQSELPSYGKKGIIDICCNLLNASRLK